jgi:D-alanine-D-alanine ligase
MRMHRTSVGVLRGGVSEGYATSLRSGAAIVQALAPEKYDVRDILIDPEGVWHMRGLPVNPMRSLQGMDVVINALYNDGIGTDGEVASILKRASIPYTGTRGTTASLVLNRTWMRSALSDTNIRMPRAHALSNRLPMDPVEMAQQIFAEFGPPYVVKPVATGTAIGIRIVRTIHDLPEVLSELFEQYDALLIEEFTPGEKISVGIIEGFRNEALYALPPSQFMMPQGFTIAELAAHEHEEARYACPWIAHNDHKQQLMRQAREVHEQLGLSHYSRSDFIVRGSRLYLVGVNAFPELHEQSSFASMLDAVGAPLPQFVEHLIARAR